MSSGPREDCPHPRRTEGVCDDCGHCRHEVVLNGACYFCGATDIDPIAMSPKPEDELVPASRLRRGKPRDD